MIRTSRISFALLVAACLTDSTLMAEPVASVPQAAPLPPKAKRCAKPLPEQPPRIDVAERKATLDNTFLRCVLSLDAGPVLTELTNKFISRNVFAEPSRLFVVHRRTKLVPSNTMKLVESSVKRAAGVHELHMRWRAALVPLEIGMTVQLDQSPELTWRVNVKNLGTQAEAFGITCPLLEHIRIGERVADDLYFYPQESGVCGGLDADLRESYGLRAYLQIMDVFNPTVGGGVYTFTKDATGYPKILILRKQSKENQAPQVFNDADWFDYQDPGAIFGRQVGTGMAIRHLQYELAAGQSATLPEILIGVHQGDWHDPLRRYRRWIRSWYQKPLPTPAWYRDTYAYTCAHPFGHRYTVNSGWNGTPKGFWDPVKHQYAFARQMGPLDANSVTEWAFWWNYKQWMPDASAADLEAHGYPQISAFQDGDFDYSNLRGGLPALREEIRRVHEKKARFLLYTLAPACWQGTRIGAAHGKEWALMNSPGQYWHRWLKEDEGWYECLYVPGWRDYLSETMARKVAETGADGYRLDVSAALYPCYNPAHKHYDGTMRSSVSPQAMADLLSACRKKVRALNPQAIVTTEHVGSDFMAQFIDGYLVNNIGFYHSPSNNPFRDLNRYRLVFTRFYVPDAKPVILGMGESFPPRDAVNMSLFNATGLSYAPALGVRGFDALRENGDAVNGLEAEPMVDTMLEGVYANYFGGASKKLWTVYNRSGKKLDQPLIEVAHKDKVRYVEVFHDEPVSVVRKGDRVQLQTPVDNEEVVCIVELPEMANVLVKGATAEIRLRAKADQGYTLHVACGDDLPGRRQMVPLKGGTAKVALPDPLTKKTIVKVMKDYYLVDEIVLAKGSAAR